MELATVKGATPLILALQHNKTADLVLYLLEKVLLRECNN